MITAKGMRLRGRKEYKIFLDNSNDPVVILDKKGEIFDTNAKGAKMLKTPKKNLIGMSIYDIVDNPGDARRNVGKIVKGTTTIASEYQVTRNGEKFHVEVSSFPAIIKETAYAFCQIRDITKKVKLEADLKKRLRDLTVLYKISKETTRNKKIEDVLDTIIKILKEDLGYEKSFIGVLDDNELKMQSTFGLKNVGADLKEVKWRILAGEGITGHVMKTGEPLLLKSPEKHPKYLAALKRTKCELTVPIKIQKKVIGVLDVESNKDDRYGKDDLNLLTNIANHIALVIENLQLQNEQDKKIERIKTIYKLAKALSSTFEQEKLFDEVTRLLSNMNQAKAVTMYILDSTSEELFSVSTFRYGKKCNREVSLPYNKSFTGSAMQKGEVLQCIDPLKRKGFTKEGRKFIETENVRSFVTVPLKVDNTTIGAINIYSESPKPFSENQMVFVESISDHVAIIIRNARLYNRLKDFNEILQEETYSATREIREKNKELRRLSNESVAEKNKIEAMIDSISEGIIVTYFDSPIMSFNPATEKILQFDSEKLGPKATTQHLSKIGLIEVLELARKVDQPVFIKEMKVGQPVNKYIKITITMLKDQDQEVGLVTVLRDITKIKEIDRMKSEFVSVVSHELRTPLTSIKGYSSLLLNEKVGKVNEQQKQCLAILNEESDRLANLINDVLDLSKMESGKMTLNQKMDSLEPILQKVVKNFEVAAKEKEISLTYKIANKIPEIPIDKDKIKQVLINLVSNAIKFTNNKGKVEITARAGQNYVRVYVKDNGRGIKKPELPRIFNKFYQIDPHMTRAQGGSGLGLVIAKEIIGLHHGLMDVKSEYGEGSEFIFLLPQREMKPAEKLKKCWEELNCSKVTCPAYGSSDRRCWLIPGTEACRMGMKDNMKDKLSHCKYCPIHLEAFGKNTKKKVKKS
jgi:PAS domain S-box-containing protein